MGLAGAGHGDGDAAAAPWSWSSRLPWPAARGERLWTQLTSPSGLAQYAVELCEPSAGHIALVLVKKPAAAAAHGPSTPVPVAVGSSAFASDVGDRARSASASPAKARRGSTPHALTSAQSAPATPRVVFVVDAIPPQRKSVSPSKVPTAAKPQQSSMASRPSPTRTLSPASTTSSSTGALSDIATSSALTHDLDELDLVDELFSGSKVGKDGCILAKAPMLCARFDCRVVAIQFTRGRSASSSSSAPQQQRQARSSAVSGALSPLRCVVAREDGVAYIWEWGADLHQWTYLNRFCFLTNANLKWTKPVAMFTATPVAAWDGETTEFAWWSLESRTEPTLCLRKVAYEQEPATFRTQLTVGHPFTLACTEVLALESSKLGLWVLTKTRGVHFRSAESLRMVSLSWRAVLHSDDDISGSSASADADALDPTAALLMCLHNVTGELVVLVRATGAVFVVTPASQQQQKTSHQQSSVTSTRRTTLAAWAKEPSLATTAVSVAAHRHLVLVSTTDALCAFSTITGEHLATVALQGLSPSVSGMKPSFAVPLAPGQSSSRLWTISGAASAVGLWSATGFWFLRTPSARAIGNSAGAMAAAVATTGTSKTTNPRAAFEALHVYGESLQFDSALQALEILEQVASSLDARSERIWRTAFASISSPSLLLALFADQSVPEALVDELGRVVALLQDVVQDITVNGRFPAALSDAAGVPHDNSAAQRLTPANVEALHHLSNWVLLAKRKITRLQTSAHFRGRHRMRPRAVSALTTVADESMAALPLASSPPSSPVSSAIRLLESSDADATNFRLSRKLRPMSSLRFASGSSSVHHGTQWLAQLEALLLDGVAFKPHEQEDARASGAAPSHLLFHEERRLDDYRSSAVASFSRHMYVESMSRLYALHEPASLVPFVQCVAAYCPRSFSLSGATHISRSHAERALTLLPPLAFFTERYNREVLAHERAAINVVGAPLSPSASAAKRQQHTADSAALARASLLAYVDLLCCCGYYVEASDGLLACGLFEHCRDVLLAKLLRGSGDESAESGATRDAQRAVYFALLAFCVQHRDVAALTQLLERKPAHVSALHVLRALRTHLPQRQCDSGNATHVTVGSLRPVLRALLEQQRRAAPAAAATA